MNIIIKEAQGLPDKAYVSVRIGQKILDFFGADTAREKHLSRAVSAPKKSKNFWLSGDTRRQAPYKAGEEFHFPKASIEIQQIQFTTHSRFNQISTVHRSVHKLLII